MSHMRNWPSRSIIREQREFQLVSARLRRNLLIEERLGRPGVRKAVTKEVVYDAQSRFARAAARFYRLAEHQLRGASMETSTPETPAPEGDPVGPPGEEGEAGDESGEEESDESE